MMILYGSTFSPFVRKVAAFAGEKGMAFELKATRLPIPIPTFVPRAPLARCLR
jgi:glutathione S-transferase